MNKICCFTGHRDAVIEHDVGQQIAKKCRELITIYGVNEFWVGNYGNFDRYAASVINRLKLDFPDIKLKLILPYFTKNIETNMEYYRNTYDEIALADIPRNTDVHYRIVKCNRYIIDNSAYMIAFVNRDGGACKNLHYAQSRRKTVFNFGTSL